MSQDGSQNGAKLTILGAKLAIIAPSWRHLGPHVRSSWRLWAHLGPSWLHFGLLLGTTLSAEAPQDDQVAARTPKTTPQTPIFDDLGSNFVSILTISCILFLCLFVGVLIHFHVCLFVCVLACLFV